jgi:hypothetical protein
VGFVDAHIELSGWVEVVTMHAGDNLKLLILTIPLDAKTGTSELII